MRNGKNGDLDPAILTRDAVRFFRNAKGTLGKSEIIRGKFYEDTKYVIESSGILWIAVLKAIRAHLIRHGVSRKSLPHSRDTYIAMLKKHSVHNGKMITIFDDLYHIVHLDGYYGGVDSVDLIKEGFQKARKLIETLTGEKIG